MFAALLAFVCSCEKPAPNDGGGKDDGDDVTPTIERVEISATEHCFKAEGDSFEVTVESSADWTLSKADQSWIKADKLTGKNGDKVTFTAETNTETVKRGPVTFTFTVGKATATFKAEQEAGNKEPEPVETLITTAGKFNATRAYPKWDGKATAFENMEQLTFEALVYHEGGWKSLNTIGGIDGYFMVRCGDEKIDNNQLQIAVANQDGTESKLNSDVRLDENKWYSIAVTFNKGEFKLYVDGEEKGSQTSSSGALTLNREHTNEEGGWNATRCFWIGYSCGKSRCWQGMISEVRIWNKALTAAEINAANHAYTVPANSEGLVAYWKFNEGEGNIVNDRTSNGNNLYCQIKVENDAPTTATATDGMEWASVSLPEK